VSLESTTTRDRTPLLNQGNSPLGHMVPAEALQENSCVPTGDCTHFIYNGAASTPSIVSSYISVPLQYTDPTAPNFSSTDANALLEFFRTQISPRFPFVVIPPSMSVENLYRNRPFLYISIIAVTSRSSTEQQELSKLVMKHLAERLIINCERSLDLLLGVLVFAGWLVKPRVLWIGA
jgi:hypothetical protein